MNREHEKTLKLLCNTIEILCPIIPQTDWSDAGYVKYYPGGVARGILDTLKNGSRLLDASFWHWQYVKQDITPNFSWEN